MATKSKAQSSSGKSSSRSTIRKPGPSQSGPPIIAASYYCVTRVLYGTIKARDRLQRYAQQHDEPLCTRQYGHRGRRLGCVRRLHRQYNDGNLYVGQRALFDHQ